MGQRTPLFDKHVASGGKMVDFGGWDMPLHYGSQIQEHHAVRRQAGMFDVSHMTVLDITGRECRDFLGYLLANDIAKLQTRGKALYTCMLNQDGGVVDDLIAYYLDDSRYRLIVNAATRVADLAWIAAHSGNFDVNVRERPELAMLAVQGPEARTTAAALLGDEMSAAALSLGPFHAHEAGDWFVARTGYTGEDGFEIVLPAAAAESLWTGLTGAGIPPIGLGARDTLRLEAGMNLYGADMTEATSPWISGLGWTVALTTRDGDFQDRDFIGRAALQAEQQAGVQQKQVGLILEDRGVLRSHQRVVVADAGDGEITSGGFSPTLERSIALARVPAATGASAQVEIRGKLLDVRVVRPPFVRHGKVRVDL